ncbi:MAG: single-stranded DNA-binding protein [Verrucomicrobia bacterium]|nr:MAG: single-stranded DNA-binding protein [Verrucomicrobiota bacterium]
MNQEVDEVPDQVRGDDMPVPATAPEKARAELERIVELMGFEAEIQVFEQEGGNLLLHIESPEAARLIGKHAQVLNALQYLLNRILFSSGMQGIFCSVDVERYRERHRDRLLQEAFAAADQVRRTGRPVRLRPMPAADRRVIHQALKDHRDIHTESEKAAQQGMKRIVIRPSGR